MESTNTYYNSKPSLISNLGLDISGAKRHNFNTYESDAEKKHRKETNKQLKNLKESLKKEVLSENPRPEQIICILSGLFKLEYGFNYDDIETLRNKRTQAIDKESRSEFNKIVNAYNKVNKAIRYCNHEYYFKKYLTSQRKLYAPKESFIEKNGKDLNWSTFSSMPITESHTQYLKDNSKAVQFGNSVTDKERSYILNELTNFLKSWTYSDLSELSWSFGARGNAKSVAFYEHSRKVISVNRNNIGSLIHEIGHYLDFKNDLISYQISYSTVKEYEATLPDMPYKLKRYYTSKKEIFARAVEAYLLGKYSEFAQCSTFALPELNEELINLVEKSLGIK